MLDISPLPDDQSALGSCTAFSSTAAYRLTMIQAGAPDMDPSELAQYFWSRQLEGTIKSDAGATIRDAVKVLAKTGMAPESKWPYDIERFAQKPPATVNRAANKHQAIEYQSVGVDIYQVKRAIASRHPVIIGISVYQSFEGSQSANTGVVPMPGTDEQLLGGHAILAVGYDDNFGGPNVGYLECRGSWGNYGDAGYHHLPYAYISPYLAGDFWVLVSVEAPLSQRRLETA
jgi:C1A family cysteine protease